MGMLEIRLISESSSRRYLPRCAIVKVSDLFREVSPQKRSWPVFSWGKLCTVESCYRPGLIKTWDQIDVFLGFYTVTQPKEWRETLVSLVFRGNLALFTVSKCCFRRVYEVRQDFSSKQLKCQKRTGHSEGTRAGRGSLLQGYLLAES